VQKNIINYINIVKFDIYWQKKIKEDKKMSIQMFALPYAGGSASIYNDWVSELKPSINVYPIEYAGHGSRFCEDFYLSIEDAAEDISEMIKSQQEDDYVIYGHSMGCLVALERGNRLIPISDRFK